MVRKKLGITKLLSAKILGILLMIVAVIMAYIHYTVTNLQSLALFLGWSEAMLAWVEAMGGTLNAIITASSFISGLTTQAQGIIAWTVIFAFFLVGLIMLWKPKIAALIAVVLLALELYIQLTTFNSVILAYGYSFGAYAGISIWDFAILPYIADVNFMLLTTIAVTGMLFIASLYVLQKTWNYDWV